MSSESNNLNTDGLYRHWAQVFQWDEKAKSGRCTICPNENPSLYFSYSEATQNHISSKHSDDCAQGTDFDFGQKPGALFRLHHRLFRCKDCSNVQLPMKASALIEHLQLEIHKNSDIPLWTIEKFVYQVKYSAKRRAQRSTNVLPDTDGQAMKSDALGRAKIEGYFGMPANPVARMENEQLDLSLPSPACVSSPEARKDDEAFSDAPSSSSPCKKALLSSQQNFNRIASRDGLAQLCSSDDSDDELADNLDASLSSSALNIASSATPRFAGLEGNNLKDDSNAEFEQPLQPRMPSSVNTNGQDHQPISSIKRKAAPSARIVATGVASNENLFHQKTRQQTATIHPPPFAKDVESRGGAVEITAPTTRSQSRQLSQSLNSGPSRRKATGTAAKSVSKKARTVSNSLAVKRTITWNKVVEYNDGTTKCMKDDGFPSEPAQKFATGTKVAKYFSSGFEVGDAVVCSGTVQSFDQFRADDGTRTWGYTVRYDDGILGRMSEADVAASLIHDEENENVSPGSKGDKASPDKSCGLAAKKKKPKGLKKGGSYKKKSCLPTTKKK